MFAQLICTEHCQDILSLQNLLYILLKYENINYMIVTQDPVCNSVLSLHPGRGVVSSVRMVSLARMVCLVRKVKCI